MMNAMGLLYSLTYPRDCRYIDVERLKSLNTRSQATIRRWVRRRSNLPKPMQKRLGFKCS